MVGRILGHAQIHDRHRRWWFYLVGLRASVRCLHLAADPVRSGLARPRACGRHGGCRRLGRRGRGLALLLRSAPPLPDLPLATLDEHPVYLAASAGRPIVLNLWASWSSTEERCVGKVGVSMVGN